MADLGSWADELQERRIHSRVKGKENDSHGGQTQMEVTRRVQAVEKRLVNEEAKKLVHWRIWGNRKKKNKMSGNSTGRRCYAILYLALVSFLFKWDFCWGDLSVNYCQSRVVPYDVAIYLSLQVDSLNEFTTFSRDSQHVIVMICPRFC